MRALTTESLMHKDQVKLRHQVTHGRLAKSCPFTLWTMDAKLYRGNANPRVLASLKRLIAMYIPQ